MKFFTIKLKGKIEDDRTVEIESHNMTADNKLQAFEMLDVAVYEEMADDVRDEVTGDWLIMDEKEYAALTQKVLTEYNAARYTYPEH